MPQKVSIRLVSGMSDQYKNCLHHEHLSASATTNPENQSGIQTASFTLDFHHNG